MNKFLFLIFFQCNLISVFAQSGSVSYPEPLYAERYRPQYHFSPAHRWIGDPCGLLKHRGRYLAYSWGAAESPDLVHWRELNSMAIEGVPHDIATFTGSVAVDTAGSAGYGRDALLAAFTSYDRNSHKQSQSIAFSHDGGTTFRYYDQNPVIDIWSTEFRDPTVIWDPDSARWVMAVAKALEKKIAFYSSPDFKHWEWMSDFGPMGDVERSWECPDIFRLTAPDGREKWILVVSVNWAREQYFVGEFNGREFVPDHPYAMPLYVDHGLDYYASRVFQDYDRPDAPVYTLGWVNTWDYAQQAPMSYGKGIWSLPRQYTLVGEGDSLRLAQQPVAALATLRGAPTRFRRTLRQGVTPLPAISAMDNCYEMEAQFRTPGDCRTGLYLCQGDGRKLTVEYDSASGYLTVDRTNVADTVIPVFERMAYAKVQAPDGVLNLHIFVDKSVVEIFVGNGERVFTLLTYAGEAQTGASVFAIGSAPEADITAWPMQSIWQPAGVCPNR